jgi:hypothetical protein
MLCQYLDVVPPNSAAGCRIMFCLRERPGSSVGQMHAHWHDAHTAIVTEERRRLKYTGYEQLPAVRDSRAAHMCEAYGVDGMLDLAGIAGLSYPRVASLFSAFLTPGAHFANIRLIRDEFGFIDLRGSSFLLGRVTVDAAASNE